MKHQEQAMPASVEIAKKLFANLTESEKKAIIDLLKSLLSER